MRLATMLLFSKESSSEFSGQRASNRTYNSVYSGAGKSTRTFEEYQSGHTRFAQRAAASVAAYCETIHYDFGRRVDFLAAES
jgi:hypothetical protein